MKLEVLERFVRKDQDLWDIKDIDRLVQRYGKKAVFFETEGITNKNIRVLKCRDQIDNDKKILKFMKRENDEYLYIIDFLNEYVEAIDFIFWVMEKPLQILYKILCERLIFNSDMKEDSIEIIKLHELTENIRRQREIEIKEEDITNEEDS